MSANARSLVEGCGHAFKRRSACVGEHVDSELHGIISTCEHGLKKLDTHEDLFRGYVLPDLSTETKRFQIDGGIFWQL
jgi:hypothetical protein